MRIKQKENLLSLKAILTLKSEKMNRIITDSIIWKEYLQKGSTREAKILEKLIKDDRVVIYGYTFAKVLKNIKTKKLLKDF